MYSADLRAWTCAGWSGGMCGECGRRGLTQEEFAARSGFSQQYLSGLERGRRNPTVVTVHELAQALGVKAYGSCRPDRGRRRVRGGASCPGRGWPLRCSLPFAGFSDRDPCAAGVSSMTEARDLIAPSLLMLLERKISSGTYVTNRELANALERAAGLPISEVVLSFFSKRLRETEPSRRGRKPGGAVAHIQRMMAAYYYYRYLVWLAEIARCASA